MSPYGNPDNKDIFSRVTDMDEDLIHPEIAAMAKEILAPYTEESVKHVSAEVASVYSWTLKLLETLERKGRVATLPAEPSDPAARLEYRKQRQEELLQMAK